MMTPLDSGLYEALKQVIGFIYPNEIELQWSILIVLYPYLTGLVAGAFILAALKRIFNVSALAPIYRLSLLTALAFLLVAPLTLLLHLGHAERAWEVMVIPQMKSPMAIFGFVYAWYFMVVLLLEIWFDYRKDIVLRSQNQGGILGLFYKVLTLGVTDISPRALDTDDRAGQIITVIGIPSAFLLHGYVGFIFGSIKANPWWGTVLMPVIFLFSAMVSGIALVLVLYMAVSWARKKIAGISCLDALAKILFYALVLDFSLEILDWGHRLYEAEESIDTLVLLVSGKLFISLVLIQVLLGTILPLAALGIVQVTRLAEKTRRILYLACGSLILIGIFAVRWNVVIGGQLFSKSLAGFTTFKPGLIGKEGLGVALLLLVVPFLLLWLLITLLPPWADESGKSSPTK